MPTAITNRSSAVMPVSCYAEGMAEAEQWWRAAHQK